jgi:ABC-type polysaccharide/polyol phosphate export permease
VVTILRWVNPITPAIYALRDPLFYGQLPHVWDVVYVCTAAAVALGLGAWVFSRVDDQIAVEL